MAPGSEPSRTGCGGQGRAPSPRPPANQCGTYHTACLPLQDGAGRRWPGGLRPRVQVLLRVQPGATYAPGTGYSRRLHQLEVGPGTALCSLDLPWDGRSWEAPWGLWPGAMGLLPPGAWGRGQPALGRGQGAPVSVGRQAGLGGTAVGLPAGWGSRAWGPAPHSGASALSTCSGGRWTCQEAPCPGTCSVLGGAHISTFRQEAALQCPGDCSYVLAKVQEPPRTGPP